MCYDSFLENSKLKLSIFMDSILSTKGIGKVEFNRGDIIR